MLGAILPLPPCLACPGFCYQQVVCSNGSSITHPVPLQLYTRLNTYIQINIMGVQHDIQIYTCTILQFFFLFLNLTSKQVSWSWALMLGTRNRLSFLILEVGMHPLLSLVGRSYFSKPLRGRSTFLNLVVCGTSF